MVYVKLKEKKKEKNQKKEVKIIYILLSLNPFFPLKIRPEGKYYIFRK